MNPLSKKLILALFVSAFVISCSKDDDKNDTPKTPAQAVVGYWKGTYDDGNFSILFKADGLSRMYNMGTKTDTATAAAKFGAPYTVSGKTVTIFLNGNNFIGTMNDELNSISGRSTAIDIPFVVVKQ